MKKLIFLLPVLAFIAACQKPYNPPAITAPGSYLVVEGAINSGSDSTFIKLSRTVNLSNKSTFNPVLGAIVTVQGDQGATYPLIETGNGNYVCGGLNLDGSHKYRLSIKTSNDQYYSDYVPVLNAPPIDSVYYTTSNTGLNVYSATHDPTNTVQYFRWDYQETWVIHSNYDSRFYSNGDTVLPRPLSPQIYTCWQSDTSSTIILNSSAKLTKSIILQNPITQIGSTAERLGSEYSILVRQYALTSDAFTFWTNLKKNTEQLGSIFDAQPSQINGNIHSAVNPGEAVVGYVSVGAISTKRIFILNQQLPAWLPTLAYPNCILDTEYYVEYPPGAKTPINAVNMYINYNRGASIDPLIPIAPISPPGSPPIGYTASEKECVDCTLRGTNVEPSYWHF